MAEVIRNAAGEAFSYWKPAAKFEYVLCGYGVWMHCRKEYEFDSDRKWRFDFAWPELKIAVEIDGFGYGHQAQQLISASHEKQNAAVVQGWRVLRYTSRQLGSRQKVEDAVEQVVRFICGAVAC